MCPSKTCTTCDVGVLAVHTQLLASTRKHAQNSPAQAAKTLHRQKQCVVSVLRSNLKYVKRANRL